MNQAFFCFYPYYCLCQKHSSDAIVLTHVDFSLSTCHFSTDLLPELRLLFFPYMTSYLFIFYHLPQFIIFARCLLLFCLPISLYYCLVPQEKGPWDLFLFVIFMQGIVPTMYQSFSKFLCNEWMKAIYLQCSCLVWDLITVKYCSCLLN